MPLRKAVSHLTGHTVLVTLTRLALVGDEEMVEAPSRTTNQICRKAGYKLINNIQLIANLLPSQQLRNLRNCTAPSMCNSAINVLGRQIVPGSLAYNQTVANVFSDATLNVQFLTPSLSVPLPPKSCVPYMEFPRYISQTASTPLGPGQSVQLTSQTITLPTIPDLLIIYVKPNSGNYTTYGSGLTGTAGSALNADYTQGDWYYSMGNWNLNVGGSYINGKPLNVNFDNFSGLLSSVTLQQLYNMSTHNGLDMDWSAWVGQVRVSGQNWQNYNATSSGDVLAGNIGLSSVDWAQVGLTNVYQRVQPNIPDVKAGDNVVASWSTAPGALAAVPLQAFVSNDGEITLRVDATSWLQANGYQSFVTGAPSVDTTVSSTTQPVTPAPSVSLISAFGALLGASGVNWHVVQTSTSTAAGASFYSLPGTSSTAGTNTATQVSAGGVAPGVGSILVLKPSQDITLQEGQAPSLVGNFTLQFNLTITNQTQYTATPTLYVITANSGFFESIRGSSRIIKGVLSEQDIISASQAPSMTRSELKRLVGAGTGGFSWDSLANIANRAVDIYNKTKPAISAIANAMPDDGFIGKVKKGAKAVGYGSTGGVGAGRSLNQRLM